MGKQQIYIHIGTPKTGTTTLQEFFKLNKEALAKSGILYPEWGYSNRWGNFENTEGNFGWIVQSNDLEIKERISSVLDDSYRGILLSTEDIWGEVRDKASFLRNIQSIGEAVEIKVIVYLRKQIDYIESQYRECIRVATFREPIESIVDFSNEQVQFLRDNCEYWSILEEMAGEIGDENIIVRPYERAQFKNGNIIDDFLSILGLEYNESFQQCAKNYNPPMSNVALEMKRIMNYSSSVLEVTDMNNIFYNILMLDGVENQKEKVVNFKSLISREKRCLFMQRYEEDNINIAKKYLKREDGRLFWEEDIKEEAKKIETEELTEQAIRVFTSAFVELNKKMDAYGRELSIVKDNFNELKILKENDARNFEVERNALMGELLSKQQEINAIKSGYSWKITAPLRKIRRIFFRNK